MARDKPPIPAAFFLVAGANFLFFLNFAFFFLLPIWVLGHGGGEEVAGRVTGAAGLAGLVALPFVGWLLDRFGRRRFMIAGAAMTACASLGFIGVEEIGPSLYALRIVQGVGFTCAFTGAQTLAVLFSPVQRRAEAIGWFGISTIVTHAISPALGEELIRRWGFDAMFAVGGGLGLLAVGLACMVPRPPELMATAVADGTTRNDARKALAAAIFTTVAYGVGFGATQTFVPVLMARFDLGRVGGFFVAWSVAAVGVRLLLGSASDRLGRRKVLIPAMAMMSFAVLLLSFVRDYRGLVAIGALFGTAQGLLYPTMNALVTDWSTPGNIGRTQSLFSGSFSLGISTCSFFFGSIVESHGYQTMFLAAMAITLVGFAVFVFGPPDRPRAAVP
jgi:MFS family permease